MLSSSFPSYWSVRPFEPAGYGIGNYWGTAEELDEMVLRCSEAGVSVIANIVLNHFTWERGNSSLGNPINSPDTGDFPSVPYTKENFHEARGLHKVRTEDPYVQQKIVEYLTTLLELGIAGFRVDLAWAMESEDLRTIFNQLPDIVMGGRPFIVHEIYYHDPDLVEFGRMISNQARFLITNAIRPNHTGTTYLNLGGKNMLWHEGWGKPGGHSLDHYVSWVDNHNTGGEGDKFLFYGDTPEQRLHYKLGISYMLASDFAVKRMFSTFFAHYHNLHLPAQRGLCGSETDYYGDPGVGDDTYVCQHRWSVFRAMVTFANHVQEEPAEMIHRLTDAIVFSRGNKGLFAMGPGLELIGELEPGEF